MKARDYRRIARDTLSGKWGMPILIMVIYTAFYGVISSLSSSGLGILVYLISAPLDIGIYYAFIKFSRTGEMSVEDMFRGFKSYGSSVLLYVLNSIFVSLWSLLFLVPGIIKAYSYAMSPLILADNPTMSQDAARRESIRLMKGNKWRYFCLEMSFFGWIILGILSLGVLYIWLTPYMAAAEVAFYEDLKRRDAMKNGSFTAEFTDKTENSGENADEAAETSESANDPTPLALPESVEPQDKEESDGVGGADIK